METTFQRLPEIFAAQNKLKSALCFFIGGAKKDSRVVVGPKGDGSLPVEPALTLLSGVSEVCGVGTIFTNENGKPTLHMHASFGRGEKAITGCLRKGVDVWLIGEVIMLELTSASVRRVIDKETGFELQKRAISCKISRKLTQISAKRSPLR